MNTPETRSSLITRLANVGDQEAWSEFCGLYEPLIYRQARRYGMQHADAREMVQDVLVAVSTAIERFQPDRQRGRFRSWLFAIGHRTSRRHFRQLSRPDRAVGEQTPTSDVEQLADQDVEYPEQEFDAELRRRAFRHVAELVQPDFAESTWNAFWKTAVLQNSIPDVAKELKMTVGSVYVARSRVMARLRQRADEITSHNVSIGSEFSMDED